MKVRDIIGVLQTFHDLDEELIVAWWDKDSFYDLLMNDGGEIEPVPQETWNAVASQYVENEDIMFLWKEEIYRDLLQMHYGEDA